MSLLIPALGLSIGAYLFGLSVYRRVGNSPFLHPVAVAMVAVVLVLALLRTVGHPLAGAYVEQNRVLLDALLVAIVAFAVPLIDNARQLMRDLVGIVAACVLSAVLAGVCTFAVCRAAGLSPEVAGAIGLRNVTNPMAIVIAQANGFSVEIAMLAVFVTGVAGVVFGEKILSFLGVRGPRQVGLVLGIMSHTFGVVRALEISPLAAAYASLAMIVTGLLHAFAVPWVLAAFALL